MTLAGRAFLAAPSWWRMIFGLASTRARLFAAARFLVDGRPCATFRFLFEHPTVFIAFFDMLGLTLLLVGVAGLGAAQLVALLLGDAQLPHAQWYRSQAFIRSGTNTGNRS
jgi:hypothetical protein